MQLRQVTRAAPQGLTQSLSTEIPAPVRGWNTRDAWPVMARGYAIYLENWYPESDGLRLRGGYIEWADTLNGDVETLHSLDTGSVSKLIAFTDNEVYDVTTAGSGTALSATITEGFGSAETFGGRLTFVNGTDSPIQYDGTTLSTPSFTGSGLTVPDLYGVTSHNERLYFWEDDSQAFWYGGVQAISGTLTKFDLQYVATLGGKIVQCISWTIDAGDGVNDLFVVFFSTGQVIVYQGSDPGSASDWSKVGVFKIPRPLGPRAATQYGGDVIVMTDDGYFPLSKALPLANINSAVSVSDLINPTIRAAAKAQTSDYWQGLLYSEGGYLLFNVPDGTRDSVLDYKQHIMNTRTGAWTCFKNWRGRCWVVHAGELYFGGRYATGSDTDQKVFKADSGLDDDGENIEALAFPAFDGLGDRARTKLWLMARPIFRTETSVNVSLGLAADYESLPSLTPITTSASAGTAWDDGDWDTFDWAGGEIRQQDWQSLGGEGFVGSIAMSVSTSTQSVEWMVTTVIYVPGGQL